MKKKIWRIAVCPLLPTRPRAPSVVESEASIVTYENGVFYTEYNSSLFLNGKVLGGTTVEQGEMKFMASLRENNSHICGGFLIDDRHILTAAHCLKNMIVSVIPPYQDFSVMLGDIFIDAEDKAHLIDNAIAHGNYEYENTNPNFDIGLIKVCK